VRRQAIPLTAAGLPRHRGSAARLLLPAVLLLCACSASRPNARPASATPGNGRAPGGVSPTAVAAAVPGVFASMLQLIPDTPETRQQTTVNDFARIRQIFTIAAPADPANPDQQQAYIAALAQHVPTGFVPTFISGLSTYAVQTSYLAQYLGYRRVDQDATAGIPPRLYEALRGLFDPQTAAQQIAGCADCPPAQTATSGGVPYYTWGEDFAIHPTTRLEPPAFDQLGRGGRVAITPQVVLRALWTDGLTQMIAAWHGGSSLFKNADFRQAADGLESLGTYSAYFTDRTQGPDRAAEALAASDLKPDARAAITAAWNPPAGTPVLQPYTLIAVGVGQGDDGQPFTGIVLIHASEQAAQQNAALLPQRIAQTSSLAAGQPWSSLLPHVQVRVSGRALIVTLADAKIGARFLTANDPLLLHR